MAYSANFYPLTGGALGYDPFLGQSNVGDTITRNIVQMVMKLLCSGQRPKLMKKLKYELFHFSNRKFDLHENELHDILSRFPNNFSITSHSKHRDLIVTAVTRLGLCEEHCTNRAACSTPLCDGLHICKFYLLANSCRFTQGKVCRYGHDLTSSHNKRLLKDHLLDQLTISELKYLFQSVENRTTTTLPKICKFYNVSGGCRNESDGRPCPYMHICKFYIISQCRFGQHCKRNHDIYQQQVKNVLAKHGFNTNRSPKEVLAELQRAGVGDAESDNMSSHSITSDRGFITPYGGRNQRSAQQSDGPRWRSLSSLSQTSQNLVPFTINDDSSDNFEEDSDDDVIVESNLSDDSDTGGATGGTTTPLSRIQSATSKTVKKVDSLDICIYYLRDKCAFGLSCRKQHKDMPYQWQYQEMGDNSWIDFQPKQNVEVEFNYSDVNKTNCFIDLRQGNVVQVDFDKLQAQSSQRHPLKIRRLSTASSNAEKYQPLATDWKWYWKNQHHKWSEYGQQDASGYKAMVDSADLEQNYLENSTGQMRFATLEFEYLMDFGKMCQFNLVTKMSRQVRRRPVFVDTKEIAKRKKRSAEMDPRMKSSSAAGLAASCIPSEWDIDRRLPSDEIIDHYSRVKISELDPKTKDEYRKVKDLFNLSMPTSRITSIERIENGELWMNFISKKEKMKRKKKSGDVNERRLFHGTYHEYVDAICRQGFDFRFSGKSVGTKYGKGSYFSKSSLYADSYTDKSNEMFVVLVLAGDVVRGESSFVRPPPKDKKNPHELYDACVDDVRSPNIYVIFTFDQVYPQYVIKYKNR